MNEAAEAVVPLVLGVTGHRDLRPEDIGSLEKQVRAVFAELRALLPHTPLALLSPLAEGADRLAARVALACDVGLIVPLPMPRAEYEKDFATPESRAEFAALLGQARQVFELPLVHGATPEGIAAPGEPRTLQYVQVGAWIVRHCQILLALWDGAASDKPGGTAQVVQYQLEDVPPEVRGVLSDPSLTQGSLLDTPENGPVYHIVTPRDSNPEPRCAPTDGGDAECGPFTLIRAYGHALGRGAAAEASYQRIYRNLDAYNRDVMGQWAALTAERGRSADVLLPDAVAADLPPALRLLRGQYAVADALAQAGQRATLRVLTGLFVYVALAVVALELYAHLPGHLPILLLLYPLLFGVAWVAYRRMRRADVQNRYQDYRALAEGLRVEFFWSLAGLPLTVADHYLRKQKSELDWIRIAVRNLLQARRGPKAAPLESAGEGRRLHLVLQYWVDGQAAYFSQHAIPRDERQLEAFERWVNVLLALSLALALALAGWHLGAAAMAGLPSAPGRLWRGGDLPLWAEALIVLIALLAVASALAHDYVEKRALGQHVKQYRRMRTLFERAGKHLSEFAARRDYGQARALLLELGNEALAESGDWVMMHRDRPIDVPHAG